VKLKSYLILFFLGASINAAKEDYSLKTWWRLEAENSRENDLNTRGDNASFRTTLNLERKIQDWGLLKISPGFFFASGNGQGLIFDNRPRNSLYANQAVFQTVSDIAEITVGAISQRHLWLRSVVDPFTSFTGVMVKPYLYKNDDFSLFTKHQATIPSSYTFSTDTTGSETTPKFYTNTLGLTYKSDLFEQLNVQLTHFKYQDLPQVIAVESAARGNLVDLTSSTTGFFRYQFQGYAATGSIKSHIASNYFFIHRFELAKNTAADDGRNKAVRTWTGLEIPTSNNTSLEILAQYFRQESDIAPARLNFGVDLNNRIGQGIRLTYSLIKEKVRFALGAHKSDPIYNTTVMTARKVIYIRMEGIDEIF
jgi:hypothetical protein